MRRMPHCCGGLWHPVAMTFDLFNWKLTFLILVPWGTKKYFERFLSLFLCLFLCQQHYEKTAGPICMKFSGKVLSDHWDDLITGKFWVNSGKRVGGSKVNLLSPAIAIWFDCGLLAVLCWHLATENVTKLLCGSTGLGFVVPRTTACIITGITNWNWIKFDAGFLLGFFCWGFQRFFGYYTRVLPGCLNPAVIGTKFFTVPTPVCTKSRHMTTCRRQGVARRPNSGHCSTDSTRHKTMRPQLHNNSLHERSKRNPWRDARPSDTLVVVAWADTDFLYPTPPSSIN